MNAAIIEPDIDYKLPKLYIVNDSQVQRGLQKN